MNKKQSNKENGLAKRLYDLESTSSNPNLSWEAIGGSINAEVSKRQNKKRRRIALWIFCGVGLLSSLLYVGSATHMTSSDASITGTNSKPAQTLAENQNDHLEQNSIDTGDLPSDQSGKSDSSTVVEYDAGSDNSAVTSVEDNRMVVTKSSISTLTKSAATPYTGDLSGNEAGLSTESRSLASINALEQVSQSIVSTETEMSTAITPESIDKESTPPNPTIERLLTNVSSIAAIQPQLIFSEEGNDLDAVPSLVPLDLVTKGPSFELAFGVGVNTSNVADAYLLSGMEIGTQAELLLGYRLSDNWMVSSGIEVGQYQFHTSFTDRRDINIYKPSSVDSIFISNGEVLKTVFTDTVPGRSTRNFTNYNIVTLLSIPLQLSYRHHINRWSIAPTIGGSLQIVEQSRGKTANETFEVQDLQSWTGSRLQGFAQIGVGYQLTANKTLSLQYRKLFGRLNSDNTFTADHVGLSLAIDF